MNLTGLKLHIKQHFGHPLVKVELHESQMDGIIEQAYKYHLKWGVGIATQETFFTAPISAGISEYVLPAGVKTVIKVVDSSSNLGGSQELFSVQNAIYRTWVNNVTGFSLIDYTISMQYIDLIEKFTTSRFNFHYHPFKNSLTLTPTPSASDFYGNNEYILIHSFVEEGYDLESDEQDEGWREHLYDDEWFQDYCIALCKITLGYVRRKFANMTSLGNASISLDGDSLVSEGKEEKEALQERLRNETWEGMLISYD